MTNQRKCLINTFSIGSMSKHNRMAFKCLFDSILANIYNINAGMNSKSTNGVEAIDGLAL